MKGREMPHMKKYNRKLRIILIMTPAVCLHHFRFPTHFQNFEPFSFVCRVQFWRPGRMNL